MVSTSFHDSGIQELRRMSFQQHLSAPTHTLASVFPLFTHAKEHCLSTEMQTLFSYQLSQIPCSKIHSSQTSKVKQSYNTAALPSYTKVTVSRSPIHESLATVLLTPVQGPTLQAFYPGVPSPASFPQIFSSLKSGLLQQNSPQCSTLCL